MLSSELVEKVYFRNENDDYLKGSVMINQLISIIVPVYNVEKYIQECIKSILKQTYSNLEIILVDDGSTDSSGDICDELAKEDNRIRVIHKQNEGVSIARNTGINIAKGKLIGFVDSDDICEPQLFEKLYGAMSKQNVDVCYCRFNDYIEGEKHHRFEPLREGYYDWEQIRKEIILPMVGSSPQEPKCAPVMGALWRSLYKLSIINDGVPVRMKGIKMAEDLLFNIEYLCRCNSAVVIDEYLYNYRQFPESSSRKYITDLYNNIQFLHEYLKQTLIQYEIFDQEMKGYYKMTVLYNMTWCISNECKYGNPDSIPDIIQKLKQIRNVSDYRNVLMWRYLRGISWPEQCYFILIKLRLYYLILWFNRRD